MTNYGYGVPNSGTKYKYGYGFGFGSCILFTDVWDSSTWGMGNSSTSKSVFESWGCELGSALGLGVQIRGVQFEVGEKGEVKYVPLE